MNKRMSIVAVAFIVIVTVGLWIARQDKPTQDQTTLVSSATAPLPAAAKSPANTGTATSAPTTPQAPTQTKRDAIQVVLQLLNHKPIEFYGRVLDQNNQPVPDVDVYASVIYNTGAAGGTQRKQTKTDGGGTFSFQGMAGRTLGIGLEKEGYEYGGGQGPFQYTEMVSEAERHHPERNSPVVFHMWKVQGPEPLAEGNRNFRLPHDGASVRIDMQSARTVNEGGDLEIVLRCEQLKPGDYRKVSWSVDVIGVNGGGVIDAGQKITAMFAAPPDGYQPSFKIETDSNAKDWSGGAQLTFYLRTAAGNFAKLWADFHPNPQDATGYVTLRWWFNPKVGSRVLEPKHTEQALNP